MNEFTSAHADPEHAEKRKKAFGLDRRAVDANSVASDSKASRNKVEKAAAAHTEAAKAYRDVGMHEKAAEHEKDAAEFTARASTMPAARGESGGKKDFGIKTAEKFERLKGESKLPEGQKNYADFASAQAWKTNSIAAHDEASKAHDGAENGAMEGHRSAEYHAERAREHEDAIRAIARGEKPKKPASDGGAYNDDEHPRDNQGRFAPK